ncbi:hypothetical protein QWY75_08525 [Pontixanthobacter aestiaquae]|uniref:Helix-turn-helix domain-containing protein n=1 Tax=Pontixanthobacter aestiaquae TaxID=1509367 RepID=A0A844Z5K1_9SPHN|nr:hypothetical protein [Pontixanthobacter aestiaquae]MDN3646244.1 hypothetical protein [Pontixanthobacter aestiaquae]MXO82764.1 hypothetical protein [Pontixanthobacter aestiaquae]
MTPDFQTPADTLRPPPIRVPPFHAVPGRARADGWTPLRQAEFIGELAETGSVAEAARRLGMARETAYRLRRRKWSAGFCAAWDAALGRKLTIPDKRTRPSRKVTLDELRWRVESGLWCVILRRGRYRGVRRKVDETALLTLCGRLGIAPSRIDFYGKAAR